MWNLIVSATLGALIGWAASKVMKARGGLVRYLVIGMAGSAVGLWLAELGGINITDSLSLPGILVSIGGACLLILLCRLILGRK